MHGMGAGAPSAVKVSINGVSNVRDVVGGIIVSTVPAAGEGDLHADAAGAGDVGEACILDVAAVWTGADAERADSFAVEVISGSALVRIAGNHPEAIREGRDGIVVGTRAVAVGRVSKRSARDEIKFSQIVDGHAAGDSVRIISHQGDVLERTILGAVVELEG